MDVDSNCGENGINNGPRGSFDSIFILPIYDILDIVKPVFYAPMPSDSLMKELGRGFEKIGHIVRIAMTDLALLFSDAMDMDESAKIGPFLSFGTVLGIENKGIPA
jgi:hypothetical protein